MVRLSTVAENGEALCFADPIFPRVYILGFDANGILIQKICPYQMGFLSFRDPIKMTCPQTK